jgi:hypothetical protein
VCSDIGPVLTDRYSKEEGLRLDDFASRNFTHLIRWAAFLLLLTLCCNMANIEDTFPLVDNLRPSCKAVHITWIVPGDSRNGVRLNSERALHPSIWTVQTYAWATYFVHSKSSRSAATIESLIGLELMWNWLYWRKERREGRKELEFFEVQYPVSSIL